IVRGVVSFLVTMFRRGVDKLVDDLWAELEKRGAPRDGDLGVLYRTYRDLPPLPPEHAERLDAITERYAIHELMRHWYVRQPSFIGYWHELLVRIAVIRFIVGGNARILPTMDAAAFDAHVIKIVYTLARVFEHSKEFLQGVRNGLDEFGMNLG